MTKNNSTTNFKNRNPKLWTILIILFWFAIIIGIALWIWNTILGAAQEFYG